MMMDEMINAYGMENEYVIDFCKDIEDHPEWNETTAFYAYCEYCEKAERQEEE